MVRRLRQCALGAAALAVAGVFLGLALGAGALWQPAAVAGAVLLALGLGAVPALAGYQYTAWIVAAVVVGMVYPASVLHWGEFDLRNKWLILIVVQAVMFGMGTQMGLRDFAGVARSPRGVVVGLLCQFSIMPLAGWALTRLFEFPPEIAAGVILIGCCSSGLASNVMTYLARANLALSVTVTAVATLAAPLATPFLMQRLAGTLVAVEFTGMMLQIVKIVVVPIGAALLHDYLRTASPRGRRIVWAVAAAGAAWLALLALVGWGRIEAWAGPTGAPFFSIVGFVGGAAIFGLGYHHLVQRVPRLADAMPYLSMAGIIYFTTVTTAAGRDDLLKVGGLLFLAAVLHNTAGYILGYWLSRALGLDRSSARAMALEVGLQNGGMASGIAGGMGKLGTVGLASAVFSPWMNISGSILANYWRRHPVD